MTPPSPFLKIAKLEEQVAKLTSERSGVAADTRVGELEGTVRLYVTRVRPPSSGLTHPPPPPDNPTSLHALAP